MLKTAKVKTFNDPIHHKMKLHPLLVHIINTPEFDRLRNIKQLGGAYHVYPGASNNRFEHSIGVAFLAGKLVKELKKTFRGLTRTDILCVEIAGLCHDLGHGPYSHTFEDFFLQELDRDQIPEEYRECNHIHELISCKIIDQMFHKNRAHFRKHRLDENHIATIKALIKGERDSGFLADKKFLYEVVANKFNEIDVDKWDYFTRDCHGLGIQHGFDLWRLLETAQVKKWNGELHIAYRDKVTTDILELFHTRTMVHMKALMLTYRIGDSLQYANKEFQVSYFDSEINAVQNTTLSGALGNMEAYLQLNDQVTEQIKLQSKSERNQQSEGFSKARELLERLVVRDIYSVMFEVKSKSEHKLNDKRDAIKKWITEHGRSQQLGVHMVKFEDKLNPPNVLVYDKHNRIKSLARMKIRKRPFEGCIRVYYKGRKRDKKRGGIALRKELEGHFRWLRTCRADF
ncbi:hypothetical protein EMCRGX_G001635 [Ephydatia muelleri]